MAKNMCPCCGLYELDFGPGGDDICGICKWHDDIVQRNNPDYAGGANAMSLNQAKALFAEGKDKNGNQILVPLLPKQKTENEHSGTHVLVTGQLISTDGKVALVV